MKRFYYTTAIVMIIFLFSLSAIAADFDWMVDFNLKAQSSLL